MQFIDELAYKNRLRKSEPALKAGLAGAALLLCLVSKSPYVGALAVAWMFALAVLLAGIPPRAFAVILLAEFGFFVFATIGVAISVTVGLPPAADFRLLNAGSLWVTTSRDMLWQSLLILSRVMGCVSAMNFLAMTTPVVDIIALSQRLHVPALLLDMMTLIYRYIFVLSATMDRMRKAQDSRMGYVNFRQGMNSAALLATRLFIETFHRSRRLQVALESRGYESGDLLVLTETYEFDRRLLWLGLAAAASLMAVWRFA
ncbi:MAG: cobalt ECF transporter T component CbiQ [Chloroflexi bacterium]|nr:cobalt ECF transporter T component CbiQ [Chloroflexota bacterium]